MQLLQRQWVLRVIDVPDQLWASVAKGVRAGTFALSAPLASRLTKDLQCIEGFPDILPIKEGDVIIALRNLRRHGMGRQGGGVASAFHRNSRWKQRPEGWRCPSASPP